MSLLNDHRSARPPAQDLVPVVLLCALAGVVLTGMAVLMSAAAVGTVLLGGPAELPAPPTWGPRVWSVLVHPDDPGAALPAPWSVLAGHAGLYWVLTATMGLAAMPVLGMIGIWIWVQFGPTSPGHASRRQLRAELSVDAARDRARVTRPSMSPAQRRSAAPTEVGVPMHRGPIGALYAPLENPTGAIAPTQSGKSRQDLVHKVIGAPGALLCSTTKPDLLEFAGIARARRLQGPVAVFDLTGSVSWPALLRWSPIQGCDKPIVADRRARTLVEAAAVQVESGGGTGAGNDKFFRERAVVVLSAYLLAAALDNKGVLSLIEWATNRQNLEPARILDARKFRDRADNLRAEIAVTPRTADGVWMSVRRVIEPLLDPRIRRMCSPAPGTGFDARSFLAAHGSLFLIAGQRQAAQAAPILTALAEYWIDTARDLALEAPARRLDPPATAVLDELPSATPIPSLPSTLADSAGRGVLIHWAAQAVSQLEETFGPGPAWSLLGNTRAITVWGGLVDPRTLEWLSTLFGHHERARWQEHSEGGFLSPTRTSLGTETVPTYRPGDVRQIGNGQVVIAYRNLGAILARTTDVARRPDWAQLRADIAAVRAGTAPISAAGYLNDEYLR